jgi:hypothetical protein
MRNFVVDLLILNTVDSTSNGYGWFFYHRTCKKEGGILLAASKKGVQEVAPLQPWKQEFDTMRFPSLQRRKCKFNATRRFPLLSASKMQVQRDKKGETHPATSKKQEFNTTRRSNSSLPRRK